MTDPFAGTYAVDWSRTVTDDTCGAPVDDLRPGAEWAWYGPATRLDGPDDVLPLGTALGYGALRSRAGLRARRMAGEPDPMRLPSSPDAGALRDGGFAVTDGRRRWDGTWLQGGESGIGLFSGGLPPQATPLWVVAAKRPRLAGKPAFAERPAGFAEGTLIATAGGLTRIERLQPGDPILTRDGATVPLLSVTARHFSGARLYVRPALRPVKVRQPGMDGALRVGPGQRLLLDDPCTMSLYGGGGEVIAAAADLAGRAGVRPDTSGDAITYHTLSLVGAPLIRAGGLWCESQPPERTGTRPAAPAPLRRVLTPPEAALLAAAV